MKTNLISSKLIIKALVICSLILAFGCDDDDDDSSYGSIHDIHKEKYFENGKLVVVYKA